MTLTKCAETELSGLTDYGVEVVFSHRRLAEGLRSQYLALTA